MHLHFTKMHGLGNDFIVINNIQKRIVFDQATIRGLADRRLGIGFDQMLIVEEASTSDVEFDYRIFNADGIEVEHCGNGARCFAQFVREKGLTRSDEILVNTKGGVIVLTVNADETVTVKMGIPEFEPSLIPFSADSLSSSYTLDLEGESMQIAVLAIGNPHAVTIVPKVDKVDIIRLGAQIESHCRFPNRVNAGFMEIISPEKIKLRVYERGVGETKACGTGACAAVVSGIMLGYLKSRVNVKLAGGNLFIQWPGAGETVLLTGPSESVFEGAIKL